jgi:Sigma-70, region 4
MIAAAQQLPPDQREVLLLRMAAGLTAPEVAAALHKTTGAVKALQHRALANLARILGRSSLEHPDATAAPRAPHADLDLRPSAPQPSHRPEREPPTHATKGEGTAPQALPGTVVEPNELERHLDPFQPVVENCDGGERRAGVLGGLRWGSTFWPTGPGRRRSRGAHKAHTEQLEVLETSTVHESDGGDGVPPRS